MILDVYIYCYKFVEQVQAERKILLGKEERKFMSSRNKFRKCSSWKINRKINHILVLH